jgi:hypothetical protein
MALSGKQRVTTDFDSVLLSLGAIPTRKCLRATCHGIELLKAADRSGPEGIVSKRRDAPLWLRQAVRLGGQVRDMA